MKKKLIKMEILSKLVRDNAFHKALASRFECTERCVEQWFYRATSKNNLFCKIYNYHVVLEIASYLKMSVDDLFEENSCN